MKMVRKTTPPGPIGAFAGLSGLCGIFRRLIPSWKRSAAAGAMEHLASLPLSAQSSLALVRVYDQQLLLGVTAASITLLSAASGRPGADSDKTASESGALFEKALEPLERGVR